MQWISDKSTPVCKEISKLIQVAVRKRLRVNDSMSIRAQATSKSEGRNGERSHSSFTHKLAGFILTY